MYILDDVTIHDDRVTIHDQLMDEMAASNNLKIHDNDDRLVLCTINNIIIMHIQFPYTITSTH